MLDNYILNHEIGRGGMASVWHATHQPSRVDVAIKFVSGDHGSKTMFDSFETEAQAVSRLDHRSIVRIIDVGTVETPLTELPQAQTGNPFLITEFVAGGTLKPWLGKVTWASARSLLTQILEGLAHAHARGIVHRDLKPSNILIKNGPRGMLPKIGDFGIARVLAESSDEAYRTTEDGVSGTPRYMAPEQVRGSQREQVPATDLYALGCIAYALITGLPPFVGDSHYSILYKHVHEEPPSLISQGVTVELQGWLNRLLSKDPRARFETAADAAWSLKSLPEQVLSDRNLTPAGTSEETLISIPTHQRVQLPKAPATARAHPPPPTDWRDHEDRQSTALRGAGAGCVRWRSVQMVGRERQRDILWNTMLEVCVERSPRVVVIDGEWGRGKSRLAQWLVHRSHELAGLRTLTVRAGTNSGLEALGIALARYFGCVGTSRSRSVELIRDILGCDGPVTSMALADSMALLNIMPLTDATVTDQQLSLSSLANVCLRTLERIALPRPLVIHIDDLHLNEALQDLAAQALRDIEAPILILATTREDSKLKTKLKQATTVSVGPLGNDDLLRILRRMIGLREDIAAQIVNRTDGNPLFALQVVDDWIERGALIAGPRGLQLSGPLPPVPDEIHEVWMSRLKPEIEGPRGLLPALQLAAILDSPIEMNIWKRACAIATAEFDAELLNRLATNALARIQELGQWSFIHQMLSESLERSAREAGSWELLHAACATALAEQATQRPEFHRRIAHHWWQAGKFANASGAFIEASRQRLRAGAYDEAAELASTAVDTARRTDAHGLQRAVMNTHEISAWIAARRGKSNKSQNLAARLLEYAREEDDLRLEGESHMILTSAHRAQIHVAHSHCRKAVALFSTAHLSDAWLEATLTLAWLEARIGRPQRGLNILESDAVIEALVGAHARRRSRYYQARGTALMGVGRLHEGRAELERALSLARETGDIFLIANLLIDIGESLRFAGHFGEAYRRHQEASELLEESADRMWISAELNMASTTVGLEEPEKLQESIGRVELDPRIDVLNLRSLLRALTTAHSVLTNASISLSLDDLPRVDSDPGSVGQDIAWIYSRLYNVSTNQQTRRCLKERLADADLHDV